MKDLKSCMLYLKKYKVWTLLGVFLIVFEVALDLFMPTIMANIINNGVANNDMTYILTNTIVMFLITLLGIMGGLGSSYFSAKVAGYVSYDIRKDIFNKVANLSYLELDKIKLENIITVISNDVSIIGTIILYTIRLLFKVPIILIGSILMLIIMLPKMSIILLIIVPILIISTYIIFKRAFPYFDYTQDNLDDLNMIVRENIGGIRVVKSTNSETIEKKKFNKNNESLKNVNINAMKLVTLVTPIMMFLIYGATIVIILIGRKYCLSGNFEVGSIMASIQYLTIILSAFLTSSMMLLLIARSKVSINRINNILKLNNDLKSIKKIKKNIDGKIEFKNVNFKYELGNGDYVLKDINLVIKSHSNVGIIGKTGSGKSTLVNLIPRFYDINEGSILIDDINIKDYDVNYLRDNVSFNFQNINLLSGTIEKNIKFYSNKDIDIESISKLSCLDNFINSKDLKYKYKLEQGAKNISGGEKNRLSIARTLYKNSPIMIFDDTMNALDSKTENTILKNIKSKYKNTTVIMVSNKINSIINMDKIIVVDDGKIIDIGKHNDLVKRCSLYKEIYDLSKKEVS